MIPRIQTGSSFKGAALYYLHDKRREGEVERLTTERVAWTHAFNTLEDDPEQVIAEMQHTAMNQDVLKRLSGNRLDGRPTELTVMTVALAWSPTQSPDRAQMIDAAQSYLDYMGWQGHQTLLVAHNDTAHPHVHLIINRVHPETGMTQDANWSKTRSQRWALTYEREQGQVLCLAREGKYEARERMHHREWQVWREISKESAFDTEFKRALQSSEWKALKDGQRQERINYWKDTGKQRQEIRREIVAAVRSEFASEWKAYAAEKEKRIEKARLYDLEARRAKRELRRDAMRPAPSLRAHGKNATGKDVSRRLWDREGAKKIEERQAAYHARLKSDLSNMRTGIAKRQKDRVVELATSALDRHGKDRAAAYRDLLQGQREDKRQLAKDQSQEVRRYDTLSGLSPAPPQNLTEAQKQSYVREAQSRSDQVRNFRNTRDEVARQEQGRGPRPGQEATDRSREQRDKEQKVEARRKGMREWYLAKRKSDRERDGNGGGRER